MLSDILSGIGTVLDAPRSLVYQGGNALARAAGYQGPEVKHFADLLGHAGMDRDSWLTQGLGMVGDMATDPLTYAGGFLGKKLGQMAFSKFGPMHGSDAAKLAGLAVPEAAAGRGGAAMAERALASPHAKAILNEVPGGSKFLGAGAESLALETPAGDVLRLSPFDPKSAIDYSRAAEYANVPTRRQVYGNIEVSRVPKAAGVGDAALFDAAAPKLKEGLAGHGYDLFDFKPEDFGVVGGRPKVLDLGSLDALDPASAPFRALAGAATPGFMRAGTAGGTIAGGGLGRLGGYLGLTG